MRKKGAHPQHRGPFDCHWGFIVGRIHWKCTKSPNSVALFCELNKASSWFIVFEGVVWNQNYSPSPCFCQNEFFPRKLLYPRPHAPFLRFFNFSIFIKHSLLFKVVISTLFHFRMFYTKDEQNYLVLFPRFWSQTSCFVIFSHYIYALKRLSFPIWVVSLQTLHYYFIDILPLKHFLRSELYPTVVYILHLLRAILRIFRFPLDHKRSTFSQMLLNLSLKKTTKKGANNSRFFVGFFEGFFLSHIFDMPSY